MKTPRKSWVLWIAANASIVALTPLYAIWLARVIREAAAGNPGVDTSADSLGIPIAGVAMWSAGLIVVVNLLLIWLLRGYPGPVPMFPKNGAKGAKTVVELVAGIALFGLALSVVDTLWAGDWELTVVPACWIPLVLVLRAVALQRGTTMIVTPSPR